MRQRNSHGGRMVHTDGRETVELRDPNDNANKVFQYRRFGDHGVERRVLMESGEPYPDGSPWEPMSNGDMQRLQSMRGTYHPILDPLGL